MNCGRDTHPDSDETPQRIADREVLPSMANVLPGVER
jgi:hypothetical protein